MALIRIDVVNNVRILSRAWAAIAGRDHRGIETDIAISTKDVPAIAPQLLCCAAVEASPDPKPFPGTIISDCHLPVMGWRTGRSNINGEPILEIDVAGGTTLRFQFPASTAKDCGTALAAAGTAALGTARPN
jgi:hypothetical protein